MGMSHSALVVGSLAVGGATEAGTCASEAAPALAEDAWVLHD
jgi:hypothetical protein